MSKLTYPLPKTVVELGKSVLDFNDRAAASLRECFEAAGTPVANLISSPGTGKTELVIKVCEELTARGVATAVLVGDCATDNDARRISRVCPMARQIVTEGLCHIEASMIRDGLVGWDLELIDLLIIENVGNLVCPSDFDLGETLKVALLAVTEGEDKPLKYPHLFATADLIVITKVDLVEACGADMEEIRENIAAINPGAEVIETSARTGAGIGQLASVLLGAKAATSGGGRDSNVVSGRRYS